jgi:hypothetical protein
MAFLNCIKGKVTHLAADHPAQFAMTAVFIGTVSVSKIIAGAAKAGSSVRTEFINPAILSRSKKEQAPQKLSWGGAILLR